MKKAKERFEVIKTLKYKKLVTNEKIFNTGAVYQVNITNHTDRIQ